MAITITTPSSGEVFAAGTEIIASGDNGPPDTYMVVSLPTANSSSSSSAVHEPVAAPAPAVWSQSLGMPAPGKHVLTVTKGSRTASVLFEVS